MMHIQPYFKLTPPTVLNYLFKVDHDVFITDLERKIILEDEGIEHSMKECGILRPTGDLFRTRPVEPRA